MPDHAHPASDGDANSVPVANRGEVRNPDPVRNPEPDTDAECDAESTTDRHTLADPDPDALDFYSHAHPRDLHPAR